MLFHSTLLWQDNNQRILFISDYCPVRGISSGWREGFKLMRGLKSGEE